MNNLKVRILIEMFNITCTTLAISSVLFLLYKIDTHKIAYSICEKKHKSWNRITNLVESKHSSKLIIYTISIKMIIQAMYLSFVQYLNNSVRKLDKNTYEVEYIIGGKTYKMVVVPKKGPNHILHIIDENDDDLKDLILPYYGPKYDWHSNKLIPEFFGRKKLVFHLDDGTEKTFFNQDFINFAFDNI